MAVVVICPQCGAQGVPLLYGYPIREARAAAEDGALALGGCVAPEDGFFSTWQCQQFHRWQERDELRWHIRIREVMVRYGYQEEHAE